MRWISWKKAPAGRAAVLSKRASGHGRVHPEALEPRRLFAAAGAAVPLGINMNDEAFWSEHFDQAVSEAKALGVGAVRVWFDVRNWDARPAAYDADPGSGVQTLTRPNGSVTEITNPPGRILKRLFQLKRAGFNVMLVVQPADGVVPTNATAVKGLMTHLMNTTETAGGSNKLKDAVDRWEIGNEPDLAPYWADSATDKTFGLKSYVDKLLLPVAEVLHSGPKDQWETVVSAGVSFSVVHLKTIVNYAIEQGKGDAIDMIGYHPYGTLSQQKDRAPLAKAYGDSVGKPVLATEWTVRGYDGSQATAWAAANDSTYRTFHKPNFLTSYYFGLLDNFAARSGLARPGSVMRHVDTLGVTTKSTPAQKTAFYKTDIVRKEPFYSMYDSWQYGSVGGLVFDDADGNGTQSGTETGVADRVVFIDADNDGVRDASEPSASTNGSGAFSLRYGLSQIDPGTYPLRQVLPSGATQTTPLKSLVVDNLRTESNVKIGAKAGTVTPPPPPAPVTTGKISGTVFNDFDGDGTRDAGDAGVSGRLVYVDLNNNATRDSAEPFATTDGSGVYAINYNTALTAPGTYALRQTLPADWEQTTPARTVALAAEASATVLLGQRAVVIAPPPPPPPTGGSITGYLWGDTNANGVRDAGEPAAGSRVVFLDADNDGVLDATEKSLTSDAAGNFKFSDLAPGTYRVRRVLPGGYRITAPVGGYASVTLAAGQNVTDVGIGSTDRALVSGSVFDDADKNGVRATGEVGLAGATVYVDANKNNSFDAGENSVVTDASGNWRFSNLIAGTYSLRLAASQGRLQTLPTATGSLSVTVKAAQIVGGLKFGSAVVVTPPVATTGKVSGTTFNDLDADGVIDAGEAGVAGRTVWLDLDGDQLVDTNEPAALSTAGGTFTINYDTKTTPAGTHTLRQRLPAGYEATTAVRQIVVAANRNDTGVLVGSRVIPTPPPPANTASISGFLFGDTNGNGMVDNGESIAGARQLWLDANDNNKIDSGEKTTTSNAAGYYTFANLAPGNYVVRRAAVAGYRITTSDDGARRVKLGAGEAVSGQSFGSTDRALISGVVFSDFDRDGARDADDTGATGWRVFLDVNNNNAFDDGERGVVTAADGKWAFTDLLPGQYPVRLANQAGYEATGGTVGFQITTGKATTATNLLFGVAPVVLPPPPETPLAQAVASGWARADAQFTKALGAVGNDPQQFVDYTGPDGAWKLAGPRAWTTGFLAGSFWQLYAHNNDAAWKASAVAWTKAIAPAATLESGDNGARFMPSYLPLYESSNDPADRAVLLAAAASKDATWDATVGAYRTSWYRSTSGNPKADFAVLLDMTNDLDLVLWAAAQTNDTAMAARATKHLETVIARLVRTDGSTAQFGLFEKATGAFQGNETFQGAAADSTWARGQAWAIKAFTDVAARTGRADFVAAAAKVADYFIDHLPPDSVPFWDFSQANVANAPKDSSAAAIAASGLFKLATVVTDPAKAAKFKAAGESILLSLLGPTYLAPASAPAGLLLHGAGNVPNNPAANDVSLIYGDYNVLEAMSRWEAL